MSREVGDTRPVAVGAKKGRKTLGPSKQESKMSVDRPNTVSTNASRPPMAIQPVNEQSKPPMASSKANKIDSLDGFKQTKEREI